MLDGNKADIEILVDKFKGVFNITSDADKLIVQWINKK